MDRIETAATPSVLVSIDDGVARITLNRPDVHNGLDLESATRLRDAARQVHGRQDVRVLLLRGAGKRFCVGVNLEWLRPEMPGCDERMRSTIEMLNEFVSLLRSMPALVVGAIHGAAAGGGFALACACDFVLAQRHTVFATAYSRIGGIPDCGTTYLLPRLVGERRALEMLVLADPFDADIARQFGLVQQVLEPDRFDAEVEQYVSRLRNGPARASAAIKRLVYRSLDAELPAQLQAELDGMLSAYREGEMAEGVLAFRQKRSPRFT